jgi:hypothetical protein
MTDFKCLKRNIQRLTLFKEDIADKNSLRNSFIEDFKSEISDGKMLDSDDPENFYNIYHKSII